MNIPSLLGFNSEASNKYVKNAGRFNWRFDWGMAKHLLHYSWPLAFLSVAIILYMKIDQLMLEALFFIATIRRLVTR